MNAFNKANFGGRRGDLLLLSSRRHSGKSSVLPSAVTVLIYIWARSARLFAQTTFVLEGENQWRPYPNKSLATLPN